MTVPATPGTPVAGTTYVAVDDDMDTAPRIISTVNMPCGGCTQVPSPDAVYIGSPPYPLPIPCNLSLLGLPLHGQWLVLAPGGCSLAPFFSASQAVRAAVGR